MRGNLAPVLPLCGNSGCGVGFANSVDKASSFPACGAVPGARKIITGFRQQSARCIRPQSFGHHRVSVLCQTPACRSSRGFSRATNAVLPNRKSKGSKYFILTKTKKRQIRICPVLLWDSLAKWNHGPRCRCRDQRASELRHCLVPTASCVGLGPVVGANVRSVQWPPSSPALFRTHTTGIHNISSTLNFRKPLPRTIRVEPRCAWEG